MDVTDELIQSLLGGVGQETAKAVTLGTTVAATALWTRIRSQFRRRKGSLNDAERAVLAAEPGQQVNADVLRGLLRRLSEPEIRQDLRVYQHYVAGDWITDGGVKNVYNFGIPSDG
jgi:hypothetical protein